MNISKYLITDRVDRHIMVGIKLKKCWNAYQNERGDVHTSIKEKFNARRPEGVGYTMASKYMRIAAYPELSHQIALEIGSYDASKICKKLPPLKSLTT